MPDVDPPGAGACVTTVEMHVGGEPVRIVTGGYPQPRGATLLDKRRDARARLDGWRSFLMAEPRGHAGMRGALLVAPDLPEADLAVLFLHHAGYPSMCGHAVLALGRHAVAHGLVPRRRPVTELAIQCPCGLVRVAVEPATAAVRYVGVPACALLREAVVLTRRFGPVTLDLGYGGACHGVLAAAELGLDLAASPLAALVEAAMAVHEAATAQLTLSHPEVAELAVLDGIILTDGGDGSRNGTSTHVRVSADGRVERSPGGSDVAARLALLHRRGAVATGATQHFRGLAGTGLTGKVVAVTRAGPHPAVLVELGGHAHLTGEARLTLEAGDLPASGGPRRR